MSLHVTLAIDVAGFLPAWKNEGSIGLHADAPMCALLFECRVALDVNGE